METTTNKNGKGGSAFLWGLIIGALIATLLTTKRGRIILREVINIGLELLENFIDERTNNKKVSVKQTQAEDIDEMVENMEPEVAEFEQAPVDEATEDIGSGVTEEETPPKPPVEQPEPKSNGPPSHEAGNGHPKKRLFRGLRRK